jgi:hypothetical protein
MASPIPAEAPVMSALEKGNLFTTKPYNESLLN